MPDPVEVVVQIGRDEVLAGRLWTHRRGPRESATFAYDETYLAFPHAYALDPRLPLVGGQLQTASEQVIFGAFSDCAPDRWGRRLVDRGERHRGEREGGAERSLAEIDYLLSVRDDLRQGALRFRDPASGVFVADTEGGIPYLIDLPTLLNAADHLERNTETAAEIRILFQGGSSLGGARPKAHVIGRDGQVSIAKFPSVANDEWDVIRWEAVALELAGRCGVRVPTWSIHTIEHRAVLIVDRFDRDGVRRIGYVSARTMLEAATGAEGTYVDIASAIEAEGDDVAADLEQLWRRVAFSILISNTDDHLRNHGFLRLTSAGWRLSPAFDINPDPGPGAKRFSTAIDAGVPSTIAALLDVAPYFGLGANGAKSILDEVTTATSDWKKVAEEYQLDRRAVRGMSPAFEHDEARAARGLVVRS